MSGKFMPSVPEDLRNEEIPILVVDDSQDNLDLMEALLISEGFEKIHLANSGQEALSTLEGNHDVGVILLDMMMPGMDGHEVCRMITGSQKWEHIPVIIVTGGALRHNEALQKSFAAGAIDFASKPINEVELIVRVHSALSLYRERVMRHHKTFALTESEENFRITFDRAPVGIAHVGERGQLILVNERLTEMLGYSQHEMMNLNFKSLCNSSWHAYRERIESLLRSNGDYCDYELPLIHKQQKKIWTRITVAPLREAAGKLKYFIHVIEDISNKKEAEESLKLAATVFDNSAEAIIVTDAHSNILSVNNSFTKMTGYTAEEVVGKNPRILSAKVHDSEFYKLMWTAVDNTGLWQGEIWNRRKNGEVYPTWLTISAVRDAKGKITNYVGISQDITSRKETEERLNHLANHDALTGLPNRTLFSDRLNNALARGKRYGQNLAILFLDLDRFKVINDTLGHDVGDLLLQNLALRLSQSLRGADTVARWGGDEFIVLLGEIHTSQDAAAAARRILNLFSDPFILGGQEIFVTASIGISIYPKDGDDAQMLLSNADTAMYRAKEQGKNNYQFYTAEMNATALERLRLESDLRRALERGEFLLYYQPKINISSGQIVGVEALIRWNHPVRGMVPPQDFIPLAEETGLIVPIGEWVLKTACRQNFDWHTSGISSIRVAVNVSTQQFRKENLTETIDRILRETNLENCLLELEITESVMMEDMERAIIVMSELSDRGIHFSIDDFGTGYSSLVYLKRFPINILKIDRSLVRHIPANPDDTAIASAIISLGKSLKLKVVAEGVETQEQLSFFRNQECDEVQGYLFSHPLPAKEMTELLQQKAPFPKANPYEIGVSASSAQALI